MVCDHYPCHRSDIGNFEPNAHIDTHVACSSECLPGGFFYLLTLSIANRQSSVIMVLQQLDHNAQEDVTNPNPGLHRCVTFT